jgi:hypothetical protein
MPIDTDELAARFTYHAPHDDQPRRYRTIRDEALRFAELICDLTPDSREQSLAITAVENAVQWANAAIARRER